MSSSGKTLPTSEKRPVRIRPFALKQMTKGNVMSVRSAALVMDRLFPEWFEHVNQFTLDIANVHHCVWAQFFGDFNLGWDLFSTLSNSRRHVLRVHNWGVVCDGNEERYTREWKLEITHRKLDKLLMSV